MDRNSILGFGLIAAVLIGFSYMNKPSDKEIAIQKKQDSITEIAKKKAEQDQAVKSQTQTQINPIAANDTTLLFHTAYTGQSKKIVLKNSKLQVTLDTHGGTISDARILNFKDRKGNKDITLFSGKDQQMKFLLAGKNENIITSDLFFTPSAQTDSSVTLTAKASNGGSINFN